jgi:ribonuclease-3
MQQVSPYNQKNTPITVKTIAGIVGKYGFSIRVNNLSLYQQALTNESYTKKECDINQFADAKREMERNGMKIVDIQNASNERLEFLGDTYIKCIVSEYIFERYNEEYVNDEGFLTCLKTRLEDTKSLAKYARQLNLGYYMLISKQIEDNNGRDSEKLLEDSFEAFIGALTLDQGFEMTRSLLRKFMETEIDYSEILSEDNNYMKRLQNFYHENKWTHPEYSEAKEEKVNGKFFYTLGVMNHEGVLIEETVNTAQNKKTARQDAALSALKMFGQI